MRISEKLAGAEESLKKMLKEFQMQRFKRIKKKLLVTVGIPGEEMVRAEL